MCAVRRNALINNLIKSIGKKFIKFFEGILVLLQITKTRLGNIIEAVWINNKKSYTKDMKYEISILSTGWFKKVIYLKPSSIVK